MMIIKGPVDFQPDYIMLDVLYQNIHKYRGKKTKSGFRLLQIWVKKSLILSQANVERFVNLRETFLLF